ncbi:MAG: long-chain-fatty-acid--CoA ligase [Chloroflexi bacterium]|nr:long-chain-fatty-acid--CoA ligase [Chloroflexota bacterium]
METIKGFPATSHDDFPLNVTTILRHAVRNYAGQKIVSRTPGGIFRYTFKDSYERIQRLANALEALGIRQGDRVGVLEWNTYRYHELCFAIPGIAAVMLQMNMRLSPSDLVYVANHAQAELVFVDETAIPAAEAIAAEFTPRKGWVILTDKKPADIAAKLKPLYTYEDLLRQAKPEHSWPLIDETSAYAGCYTTGTTGRPKGVYYSHRNGYLMACTAALNLELTLRDSLLQLVPIYHVVGWFNHHAALLTGAKIVFPGRFTTQDMGPIIDLMVQEKVTAGVAGTAVYMPMLEYIRGMEKKPDFSRVRFVSGASRPPISMIKGFYELTGATVYHGYGATENTAWATTNKPKPWTAAHLTNEEKWAQQRKQGLMVVGCDVRIVGANGTDVPHDGKSPGELLMRAPWVNRTYYNTPEAAGRFTEDGYWRSGDVATIDLEGYIEIVDRLKDVIKSGGEWISSVDMENEIMEHPAVLEAAVCGIPHPKWDERPLALAVLRPDFKGKTTKEDIIKHLSRRFAKWQLPDEVKFVDEIPKTSVGKFKKSAIREQYRDEYMKKQG